MVVLQSIALYRHPGRGSEVLVSQRAVSENPYPEWLRRVEKREQLGENGLKIQYVQLHLLNYYSLKAIHLTDCKI